MPQLKHILIIDDNDATNHFHRRLIEKLHPGISVYLCENGKVGFDHFVQAAEKPSLIFLDLNMPVMDGFEFLGVLDAYLDENQKQHTHVVILSSSDEDFDKNRTKELYWNISFNPKPLSKDKLSGVIESVENEE